MDILADIAHVFGAIFILLGIFIFFLPRKVVSGAEQTDRLFNVDGLVYAYRYIVGLALVVASIYLFWVMWQLPLG